ncbi:EamA family transporter [candidate division KSB1 bacterium]
MSIWILLVVVAQFISAIVAVVDKYIVTSRVVSRPVTYAFYVSILSAFSAIVFLFSWIKIPFEGISIPSVQNVTHPDDTVVLLSLIAGFAFFGALVSLFTGLKRADTSDVIPVVGATSAVSSLLLGFYFLKTSLTTNFVWGFALLVLGTFFISLFRFKTKTLIVSLISGMLFALHFVCLKILFGYTGFDNAFFWSRMGIVIPALLAFVIPWIHIHPKKMVIGAEIPRKNAVWIILGNKFMAGVAGLLILKGIELGDVIIVQALGGLQFVFLLLFAVLTGKSLPQACGEKCSKYDVWQKTISVGIITIGFLVLFL